MSVEGNVENQELNELKGKIISIPQIDASLEKEGYAADAKVTGDAIRALMTNVASVTVSDSGTMGYDNTNSGLTAVNVQSAIDEVAAIAKNALPEDGTGMITGSLKVRNADNGYAAISKNNSATADYGTQLLDVRSDGKSSKVVVSAATGLLTYVDADNNIRDIFHEGNKAFGSYTGNGNTTETLVATGSIGRLILVYNGKYFNFVTPQGALSVNMIDGTIKWIDNTKVFYINGVIKYYTNNEALNAASTTYNYQAI